METIKKILVQYKREIIIVGLVILLLSVWTCSHNAQKVAQGETKQLKEQLKQQKDGVEVFRKEQKILFDSISLAEKIKDKKISELHNSNEQLSQKLKNSQKELQQKKDSYKNKSFEQLAQVFRESGYKDVSSTNNSVNLEKNEPIAVLEDLAEGLNCFTDLQIKDSIISNKDEEIKISQEKIKNRDLILLSKTDEVEKLDGINQTQEEIIKKTEKQLRQLKTKNFLTTYILPPLVFIGGAYVGTKVVK